MARFRQKYATSYLAGGETFRSNGTDTWSHLGQGSLPKTYESGWDTVHSGPPFVDESNFDKSKTTILARSSLSLRDSDTGTRRTSNFDALPFPANWHVDQNGPIGVQSYVNQALANLNPNNPIVDVPLFLFELRELPGLLRDAGKFLSNTLSLRGSNPGSVFLSYQFGWAPLFSDLNKLLSLVNEIEAQRSHIMKNVSRRSASGSLDNISTEWNGHLFNLRYNPGENIQVRDKFSANREVWYSARIKPDFTQPFFGEDKSSTMNRVLGLNASASTIWNALPWSWLIDYFISVGSYLGATRGVLPYSISNMNIMARDTTRIDQVFESSDFPDSYYTFRGGKIETVRKRRWVYVVPKARVAFRSNPIAGKASILTSLFVSRFK